MHNLIKYPQLLASCFISLSIFVLWILSQKFVTKDELRKITKDIHLQDKAISNLSTKLDNAIKSVDMLTSALNDIRDFIINSHNKN